jgi:hypothetical protein
LAKAGKGKRWRYDLGVGRVRVPGKPRRKGLSYKGQRRGTHSGQTGGISWGQAFLAVMTGGVSLLFRGGATPTTGGGRASRPSRHVKRASRSRWANPALQVDLPTRTANQISEAKAKFSGLRREIRETEVQITRAKQSRDGSGVTELAKNLKELRHFENQWEKQLSLLQDEVVASR